MNDFVFKRWTKGGNDRVYVKRASGEQLGYYDIKRGLAVPERGHDEEHITLLFQAWAQTRTTRIGNASSASRSTERRRGPAPTDENARWTDLSGNRPGQAAAAKAEQEWANYSENRPTRAAIARFLGIRTPDRAWARGAAGEHEVGGRLEQLWPGGWRVIHAIPIGHRGADIDHLLIGPGGVFTINTKNHSRASVWIGDRRIMVNGQKTDHLRNAIYEAKRVEPILSRLAKRNVPVTPTLVIMARQWTMNSRPADVLVLKRLQVPQYFERLPIVMSAEQVEQTYDIARRSTTWTAS